MTDTGSGIRAGKVFPVPVTHGLEAEHRRLLAEAVNHLGAAGLTPHTQYQAIEDVDFSEAGADLGFSISVTPYVPARAHILLILQITNADAPTSVEVEIPAQEIEIPEQIIEVILVEPPDPTFATIPAQTVEIPAQTVEVPEPDDAVEATVELNENGTPILTHESDYAPSGGGSSQSLVLQVLRDLEPNTTYVYTVTGYEGAPAKNISAAVNSSLTVRLEHRIIATL